jgi:hypothetical protein
MQIVESIFDACSEEETVQFMGLARHIWLRRNEVLYGGVFTHQRELMIQTIRVGRSTNRPNKLGMHFQLWRGFLLIQDGKLRRMVG